MNSRASYLLVGFCMVLAGCGGSATPATVTAAAPGALMTTATCRTASSPGSVDAWTTFAFNQTHTDCNPEDGGITASNVSQLHKIWEFSQSNPIFASPIAVNGSIYVATLDAGTVIALNATTGAKEWSTTLASASGEIRQTPVYDNGMLFVGIHGFGPETANGAFPPVPSTMYALNATTGRIVWSTPLQGNVRSSPAVANGTIFVPVAGGDPPFCLQGGIDALNEQTGQPVWNFYVDPTPNDGGAVWSPVAYDGTRLIFGTGNTCHQTPLSANAIVAVNPANGSLDWELNTAQQTSDDDVGAGVLVVNGMAVTIAKTGVIYYLDEATGAVLHEVQTQDVVGAGGYSTPATDGSTVILGTSAVSASSTASADDDQLRFFGRPASTATGGGRLMALDMAGNVKWTITTSSQVVDSSVAISNGIAFADIADEIEALSVSNGGMLWSFTAPAEILSSPIVVPSGVYTADLNGNVYKFGL